MPLLKFDVIQGRDDEQLRALLDSAHMAMVEAFEVPLSDRYQCVTQHRPNELVIHDTGLNLPRSNNVVLLTVVTRPRSDMQKTDFYRLLVTNLRRDCGLRAEDVVVSLVENKDADWSFGLGEAQFLTGAL
ncbi:tautomerase family protein [Variovorax sp. LjRoot290]|uniref:tautomerase family protein n=1 Tax=Variovorax sp. LjRoot290 TaxID=3342316 RepID=UPI003ECD90A0